MLLPFHRSVSNPFAMHLPTFLKIKRNCWNTWNLPITRTKMAKSLEKENNVFFLAFVENVPVGFAKVKKHSLNEQIESIAQMELQKIYVLSYYHGSGAGQALFQAVVDLANEIQPDFLWLDTHVSNAKAIRFYEKNG